VAEDVGSRRRGRWLVFVLLLAFAGWLIWARRAAAGVSVPATESPILESPAAEDLAPPEAEPEPSPGAAAPLPDGSPPGPAYTIKGNAGSMLFHLPSSPYYERTKPDMWFRTAEDATAAGFTQWRPKKRATG
jgi:hypothetical protein